ncbi:MAG TPA: carotenoid oxygenase family protein [Ramlibacter sp.]|nr:carotenoid oxygenase family protein [Ramlibacter sp.]
MNPSDHAKSPSERRGPMLPRWDGAAVEAAFESAAQSKRWTLGYRSAPADDLSTEQLTLSGSLPRSLLGTFYRNGPSRHGRGGHRYGHRWDGDGMVQAFDFNGVNVSHKGSFVRTRKWVQEGAAGRLLFNAFGTRLPGTEAVPVSLDDWNPANISVLRVADELLALWEPGSAYVLDPHTLQTIGIKTWSESLVGVPFSAHPRREPDGTVWNFGVDPLNGALYLFHISPAGQLLQHRVLNVKDLPPVHDFAVTSRHLVIALSSMSVVKERLDAGQSFAESCAWRPDLVMRVLVIDKIDFRTLTYELPAGCLFHIGNAWEDDSGVIRFDMMRSDDPRPLLCGWSIMRGEYRHTGSAVLALAELKPHGIATLAVKTGFEGEFPVVDPSAVGRRYEKILCVARSTDRAPDVVGYDEVAMFDMETHDVDRYRYGADWLVEEHLLVPDSTDPAGAARWVIGTALDLAEKQTALSVFDARSLASGPVAQARLPYVLPLGLHGRFEPRRQ